MTVLRRCTSATLGLLLGTGLVAGQLPPDGPAPAGGPGALAAPVRGGGIVEDRLELAGATVGERVRKALRTAEDQKGDRYQYGAEGPKRFDCSGLVYFATHRAGFDGVPRTSADQARHMRHIKRKELRPGDFVFFTGSSGVYHVGIYVGRRHGDRAVVHAPEPGTRVRVEEVWGDSWFAATLRR